MKTIGVAQFFIRMGDVLSFETLLVACGRLFAQRCLEGVSILGTHQIVENRVESGGEEVETAGEVEEIFVERSPRVALFEVNITKSLDVERCPGDEEKNNDRH